MSRLLRPLAAAHAVRLTAAALLLAAALPCSAYAEDAACRSWPGEIEPLPSRFDADPLRARWARLRSAELAQLALSMPPEWPSELHRLWVHVRCLDPEHEAAARWLAQPTPRFVLGGNGARASRVRLQGDLLRLEDLIARAEFRAALASASEISRALARGAGPRSDLARVSMARGAALAALGREAEAVEAFGFALRADPSLPVRSDTSPKLLRLIERARVRGTRG